MPKTADCDRAKYNLNFHDGIIMDTFAMATLTIKNLPDDLYLALKLKAVSYHRSLNREAIASLEQAIQKQEISPENILLSAQKLRVKKNTKISLTNDEINDIKNQGRL